GPGPADGNEVAANVSGGIELNGSAPSTLQNNTVGLGPSDNLTDVSSNPYANGGAGVSVVLGSSNNQIGTLGAGNEIVNNDADGIAVSGAANTVVGGLGAGDGNVSSANLNDGIDVENNSAGTSVLGNVVGTNAAGTLAFPNDRGLRVEGNNAVIQGNSFAGNV